MQKKLRGSFLVMNEGLNRKQRAKVWKMKKNEKKDIGGKMITLDQAKALKPGDIIYHATTRNADGTAQRWKVNGRVKTWKTLPGRVSIPVKHGLRSYDYVDEKNLHLICLSDPTKEEK